jgi:hypothetical protein
LSDSLVLSTDELFALARLTPQARLLGLITEGRDRSAAARAERGTRALRERGLLPPDAGAQKVGPLEVLASPDLVIRATHRTGVAVETRSYISSGELWDELRVGDGGYVLVRGRGRFFDALLAFAAVSGGGRADGEPFVTSLEALNRAAQGASDGPPPAATLVNALRTRAAATEVASLHWEGRRLVGGELMWIDGAGAGIWILEAADAPPHAHETHLRVEPVTRQGLLRRLFEYLPGARIGST